MNKPIKFDPNKPYQWKPEDSFIISGKEYSTILATLRSILETEEANTIFLAQRASDALHRALVTSVENGIAKEIIEDSKENEKTS